jgi:methoxymalonate biosynthesis acyl carrier protein
MSPTATQVEEALERHIRERFGVRADDSTFGPDVHLFEEGYVDSTGLVEVIAFLEVTFEVRLPEDALFDPTFNSVRGIAKVVAGLAAGDA